MSTGAGGGEIMEVNRQANPRRCAACKYLRRRCASDCILASYFPASHPQRYANVHAVFGTSNLARVLQSLPMQERAATADTMATEAHWRVQDPVYGSAGVIDRLQEEIRAMQGEIARTRAQLALPVRGTTTQSAPRQGAQPPPSLRPLPLPAAAAVRTSGHFIAVYQEEAPLMDPDEFFSFDGRL